MLSFQTSRRCPIWGPAHPLLTTSYAQPPFLPAILVAHVYRQPAEWVPLLLFRLQLGGTSFAYLVRQRLAQIYLVAGFSYLQPLPYLPSSPLVLSSTGWLQPSSSDSSPWPGE